MRYMFWSKKAPLEFGYDLVSDHRSEDPFSLQIHSLDARSRITFEPINGESGFPETAIILFCS